MHRQFIIALNLMFLLLLHSVWSQDTYQETALLFPGESHTFNGVKVEWRTGGEEKPAESPLAVPGDLVFTGPKSAPVIFPVHDLIYENIQDNSVTYRSTTTVFVDGVVFFLKGNPRQINEVSTVSLEIKAIGSPIHTNLTGESNSDRLYVSAWTPITINDFTLSYSKEMKTLADGAQYYMLQVDSDTQNIHEEIPIAMNALRKIGRFTFGLGPDDFGKSTLIKYEAELDLSLKGRDAIITDWNYEAYFGRYYMPIQDFFDLFSKDFNFSIEWKDQEGFPESAETVLGYKVYVQKPNLARRGNSISSYGSVENVIRSINSNKDQVWVPDEAYLKLIEFTWESPTKLIAQVINMDELARRRTANRERDIKNKNTRDLFETDYKMTTKAYPITSITAETALDLIKPDLKTWYLRSRSEGTEVWISSTAEVEGAKIEDARAETALIAADRSAVILTAIAKHHALFEERLASIDKALGATAKSEKGRPHQLIVTLLVGSQEARQAGESSEMGDLGTIRWDPALAEKFGLTAEDLDAFGIKTLGRAGVGMVSLLPEKGTSGRAQVALSPAYSAELEFEDMREPYLVLRGRLIQASAPPADFPQMDGMPGSAAPGNDSLYGDPMMGSGENMGMMGGFAPPAKSASRVLMQNTLYLQPGQAEMLGVTNLREALILVVEWKAEKQ